MTDLTSLTLAEARDRLKSRAISSLEITKAHLEAISSRQAAQRLCRDDARTRRCRMAESSDLRLARGEGGPLEGLPIGVKDLYATEGVHTQACSHILDGFKPPYESTVTAQSLARRRGDARQTQHGRVRDGLVERNVLLRSGRLALAAAELGPRPGARGPGRRQARPVDARRLFGRLGRRRRRAPLPGGDRQRHRRLDPPARGLHWNCRDQADLRSLLALGHGGLRLVARPGGTARAHGARRRHHAAFDGRPRLEGLRPALPSRFPTTRPRSAVRSRA